jgi:hypothetical protein
VGARRPSGRPGRSGAPRADVDPDQHDRPDDALGQRLATGATTWTLDLDDPYAWHDFPVDVG